MSHTPPVDSKGAGDELDKILFEWVPAGTRHRLKTAILAILAQEVNKARIDELKKMPNHTAVNLYVRDRIKDLERLG